MTGTITSSAWTRKTSIFDPVGRRGQKISLLLDYTDRPGEVADPWYTGNFDATWRDVQDGCRGFLQWLRAQGKI